MTIGKVGVAHRVWFGAQSANGSARSGLVTASFTITVRDPGNTATMAPPTVTEVAGTGLYFFDILAAFTTTHGAGEYGVFIEVTTPPRAVDDPRVVVFVNTFDDIASRLPAALVGGRMDSDVGNIQAVVRALLIDEFWNELLAGHLGAGAAGRVLNTLTALPVIKVSCITTTSTPGTVRLLAVLERVGALITDPISATISLKDPTGAIVIADAAMTGPNADGVFRRDVASVTLADVTNFYADVSITDGIGTVRQAEITPTIGG